MHKINLAEKFDLIGDFWKPRIAAELNDSYVKLAKFKGEFIWHRHDQEDELFLVVKGNLRIRLRDGEIQLSPGEFAVVPRGVDHLPIAEEETCVLLLEPKSTLNTGNQRNQRTVADLEWV
jgi:mannose-6-phosphate isomerase-like protein (cupin superfamily)